MLLYRPPPPIIFPSPKYRLPVQAYDAILGQMLLPSDSSNFFIILNDPSSIQFPGFDFFAFFPLATDGIRPASQATSGCLAAARAPAPPPLSRRPSSFFPISFPFMHISLALLAHVFASARPLELARN